MSNITIGIKVQTGSLVIENEVTNNLIPGIINAAPERIGSLPYLLSPTIGEAVALPLDWYKLSLKAIISLAVIQQTEGSQRYLLPLQNGVVVNHPGDLFRSEDFSSCVLDQRTVVTFDESWVAPSRQGNRTRIADEQPVIGYHYAPPRTD